VGASKFFTNNNENTLINKFEGVIGNNPSINCFDAVVGYLRGSGYYGIRPFLEKMTKTRVLVGINADRFIADANAKGQRFFPASEQAKNDYLDGFKKDTDDSEYTETVEKGILDLIDDIKQGRIEVRAHPSKKIHAKIYILYPENFNEHTFAAAITGSSNLSGYGLGIGIKNEHQYEFNVLLSDNADVQFAKDEFNRLWEEAEGCTILPADIERVKQETYLSGDVTPYELYIKTLIEYFGDAIDYKNDNPYELPEGFKEMEYQMEAVNEGYQKLLKYDGVFLSDVVGLGKTIIATMIAKRFLIENGINNTKILVVYPPALEKNWKSTFTKFSIDHAKFISNGSLAKILDEDSKDHYNYYNAGIYDLVLVDESHKYRNHETERFQLLQEICKCPRINRGKIGGRRKKVVLISATPLNNSPADIYNQILLFQNPRRSTLDGVPNLTAFFSHKIETYKKLKANPPLNIEALKELYEEIREKIIKPITVRRTRRDIEETPRFAKDAEAFPKVQKPIKIEYVLDENLSALFDYTVSCLIGEPKHDSDSGHKLQLTYARYKAISYLKPEIQDKFYEKADLVSASLARIMETLLIKRLESSFFAFKKSLERFQAANRRMIDSFKRGTVYIAPDLNVNKFYEDGLTEEEIEEKITAAAEKNPQNRIFEKENFESEFIKILVNDQKILDNLAASWKKIGDADPKLAEFIARLNGEFFDKKRNPGQKLVVFSESTETIEYLQKNIKRSDTLAVSAQNRGQKFTEIETNFDANIKPEKQKNDYNIILASEVLAEGVNLHRSNIIVNYDTPWNSTKLMQRIGRVNRIGSVAKNIYNYVFYPSAKGDKRINLINNSLAKIQAFHTAFGEDSQIYSTDEIVDLDLSRLFDVGLPIGELNMELQYREEIRKLKAENPQEYSRIEKMGPRRRTGRNAANSKGACPNTTLAFLKTDKIKNFFIVNEDGTPQELSALQAINIFKADNAELPTERIPAHHKHVRIAEQKFQEDIQSAYKSQDSITASGKQVKTAVAFLREHKKLIENPKRSLLVDHLIKLVEWGTLTHIATDLNKMEKDAKNGTLDRQQCLAQILEKAEKYDLYYTGEQKEQHIEIPLIILSESFK
jgi:superfamily II DNA/RNA helicase